MRIIRASQTRIPHIIQLAILHADLPYERPNVRIVPIDHGVDPREIWPSVVGPVEVGEVGAVGIVPSGSDEDGADGGRVGEVGGEGGAHGKGWWRGTCVRAVMSRRNERF